MTGTVGFILCERDRKVDTRHVETWLANGVKHRMGDCWLMSVNNFKFYNVLLWQLWDQAWCWDSESEHIVYFVELTIPFEDAIEEAFEKKKVKYAELVVDARQWGWQAHTRPVEISVRGFVAKSTTTHFGFRGLVVFSSSMYRNPSWIWTGWFWDARHHCWAFWRWYFLIQLNADEGKCLLENFSISHKGCFAVCCILLLRFYGWAIMLLCLVLVNYRQRIYCTMKEGLYGSRV